MEQEVLSILKYYEDYNMKIDYNFVKNILTILRNYYHTEEQLKTFIVFNGRGNTKFDGRYARYSKQILIDLSYQNNVKFFGKRNFNFYVLLTILHEFEHVIQAKYESVFWKRDYYIDDFLIKLIDLSDMCPNVNNPDIHDFIPDERLANIKSTYKLIKILKWDESRYREQINKLKFLLYHYIINGYNPLDRNMCSIKAYIDMVDDEDKKRFYDIYEKMYDMVGKESINKRILYGLPISEGEYNLAMLNYIKYTKLAKRINKK